MSPHETKVRAAHPRAEARREGLLGPWSVRLRASDPAPAAEGDTEEAAWVNTLRAIDPEDRTPLPAQSSFLEE